jgi:SnoaL-like domain
LLVLHISSSWLDLARFAQNLSRYFIDARCNASAVKSTTRDQFRLIYSRHCLTREGMIDKNAILAANAAFYEAFAAGNAGQLIQLWADDDDISCIHPGWPAIIGRTAVIGSWRDILLSENRPQITCEEPYPVITGDCGRVLCVELIGSAAFAASNHFRHINGIWRLVHHQSSPIARTVTQVSPDPSGQVSHIH